MNSNEEKKPDTTTTVLAYLGPVNNSPNNTIVEQDRYLKLPYTTKQSYAFVEVCPQELGDELVVSLKFLAEFNLKEFIYDLNETIIGIKEKDGKQILFARGFKYIAYEDLQSIHEKMTKKFNIVDMGEYGKGLAAKEKINQKEFFFYPGILTSFETLLETGRHHRYAVRMSLQKDKYDITIDAAKCKGGYAHRVQHAPSENAGIKEQIALSNVGSANYYTKVEISGKMTIIPLLAFQFIQNIQRGDGILIDYGDQYWEALSQAHSYFKNDLKPLIEQVRLNFSQKHLQKGLINFTLTRKGIEHILKHGYVSSATTCYILPQCSLKTIKDQFDKKGFVSCNGLMLPAIILIDAKNATVRSFQNGNYFLIINRSLSPEAMQAIDNDFNKKNVPTFIAQLQMVEMSNAKTLLMIPIKTFQQLEMSELNKLIKYIEERTGYCLKMHGDNSLLPQALEDKSEEPSSLRP
jgi:hypothetical protein